MAKRLISKTWNDIQEEMSISGEPEKCRKFGEAVYDLACNSGDTNNIPTIQNQIFALERVIAELKNWEKILKQRQHTNHLK